MAEEFKKTGMNTVASANGFIVEVKLAGGVIYRDDQGETRIDSEWSVNPHGIVLYTRGFEKVTRARFDTIFSNVTRALEYMGHPVQVEGDLSTWS
jgi:hypothetical protein